MSITTISNQGTHDGTLKRNSAFITSLSVHTEHLERLRHAILIKVIQEPYFQWDLNHDATSLL